jgi:flagellar assembly factor FliW
LKFLQCEEQPDISFTCVDVGPLVPTYVVPLSDEDAAFLALEHPQDCLVLAMVVGAVLSELYRKGD